MLAKIESYFPGTLSFTSKTEESFLKVSSNDFYLIMFFLKMHQHMRFKVLMDISVADHPEKKERLQLFYCILSLRFNTRLSVLMSTTEVSVVDSISTMFSGAN